MLKAENFLEVGMKFHGHKCPAMPLGLRAAIAAMNILEVEHSQDKELYVISETGKGHAAGCFLDGIMVATGCTYGKSNIEKLYYNKMAFTLIDVKKQKAVRVSLKPEFFANMLHSPFVEQRKKGVAPQDVLLELIEPLVKNVMTMPEEKFLDIKVINPYEFTPKKGIFEIDKCASCGEMVFVNKLIDSEKGKVCMGCASEKQEK